MPTIKAAFGRGIPLVDLDQVPAIPCCLVFQLGHKFTPTHITNRFSQEVILDHVLDCQALDAYCLVLTNNASRELVLIIPSAITDMGMDASYLVTSFLTILAPLAFLGESSLCFCQFLFVLSKELRVAHGFTCREYHHRLEPQVKPDFLLDCWQGSDFLLYQERNEVAVGGIFAHRYGRRLATLGQRPRPLDSKGCFHLGKGQVLAIPFESRGGIFCGLLPLFLLEGR